MSDSMTLSKLSNFLIELNHNADLTKKEVLFHTPDGKIYRLEAYQNHDEHLVIRLNDDIGAEFAKRISEKVKY
jgi:hypothetical protein